MKRRDLVQSHSNRILFIAQWFGCLETCPTDHRVKGIRVSPPWLYPLPRSTSYILSPSNKHASGIQCIPLILSIYVTIL